MNSIPSWLQQQDERVTIFNLENCRVVVAGHQLLYSTLRWLLFRAWCSSLHGQSWSGMPHEWATQQPGCQEPSQATRWQEAAAQKRAPTPGVRGGGLFLGKGLGPTSVRSVPTCQSSQSQPPHVGQISSSHVDLLVQ